MYLYGSIIDLRLPIKLMPRVMENPILMQVTGCLKVITYSGIGKVNLWENEPWLSVIWLGLVIHTILWPSISIFCGECCILSNHEFRPWSSWLEANGKVSMVEWCANSHSRSTMISLWSGTCHQTPVHTAGDTLGAIFNHCTAEVQRSVHRTSD